MKKLTEDSPVNNGRSAMNAIKKSLWMRGIKARDVSTLNTGYDLLVEGVWKVECKSSIFGANGYVITNIDYLKFDILAVALFNPLMDKYSIHYLKNKYDIAKMAGIKGTLVTKMRLNKTKIDTYFTNKPKEVFDEIERAEKSYQNKL